MVLYIMCILKPLMFLMSWINLIGMTLFNSVSAPNGSQIQSQNIIIAVYNVTKLCDM